MAAPLALKSPPDSAAVGTVSIARLRLGLAEALVVREEERLLPEERTADRAAVVILHQMAGAGHLVPGARVERIVPQKLIPGPVELAAALAGNDIHLAAARAAQFRRVTAGLHLKLLYGIRRQTQVHGVERRVRIRDAIEQVIVRVGPVAADGDRGPLAGAPVERAHVAGLGAMADVRVRHGERQVDQHPAIQRQVLNRLRFHHFANAGVLRFQDLGGRDDLDDLVFFAEFEREIEPHVLADFRTISRFWLRKPGGAHFDAYSPGARFGTSNRPS